ncbi:hypothetical protein HMI54_013000 [Coelomomyces lativittatus]|nr:hypothetical protein HMI56_007362 [Coelomomyces lativittatus]KAJ1515034.1 hypothetical protein HMI54_013000 [Coelomomyces lativittatus]
MTTIPSCDTSEDTSSSDSSSPLPSKRNFFLYVSVPPPTRPYFNSLSTSKRKLTSPFFTTSSSDYNLELFDHTRRKIRTFNNTYNRACLTCFRPIMTSSPLAPYCSASCDIRNKNYSSASTSPSSTFSLNQGTSLRKKMRSMFQTEVSKFILPLLETSKTMLNSEPIVPLDSKAILERAEAIANALENAIYDKYTQVTSLDASPSTSTTTSNFFSSSSSSSTTTGLMTTSHESLYKEKCRSIFFSLKNPKLQLLRHNLVHNVWTAQEVIDMNPQDFSDENTKEKECVRQEELAKVIKKDAQVMFLAKKTHKGIVEVRSPDPMPFLDKWKSTIKENSQLSATPTPSVTSTSSLSSSFLSLPPLEDTSATLALFSEAFSSFAPDLDETPLEVPEEPIPKLSVSEDDLNKLISESTRRVSVPELIIPTRKETIRALPLEASSVHKMPLQSFIPLPSTTSSTTSSKYSPSTYQAELLAHPYPSFPVVLTQMGGRHIKNPQSYFSSILRRAGRISPPVMEQYILELQPSRTREVYFFDVQVDLTRQKSSRLREVFDEYFFNDLRKSNHYDVMVLEPEVNLVNALYILPFCPTDEFPEPFDVFPHTLPLIRNQNLVVAVMVAWLPGCEHRSRPPNEIKEVQDPRISQVISGNGTAPVVHLQ